MRKPTVFIGVTGVAEPADVGMAIREFDAAKRAVATPVPHVLMLGVLVTHELMAEPKISTLGNRYPPFARARSLLEQVRGRAFPMFHYCPAGKPSAAEFESDLFKLFGDSGFYEAGLCRAVQLNAAFETVSPESVEAVRRNFDGLEILLQANRITLSASTASFVDRVAHYASVASHVLIDPSGGQGVALGIDRAVEVARALRADSRTRELAQGFAGGLNGENCQQKIGNLVTALGRHDFFVDSESGVRDRATDLLSPDAIARYLRGSLAGLAELKAAKSK